MRWRRSWANSGRPRVRLGGRIPQLATRTAVIRALVVEDDEDMLTIIRGELDGLGYRVTAVAGGHEAVEAAQRQPFDLLVTNMNLPDIKGQEVIERVRRSHPDIPIIVVSGSPEAQAEAREMGVERFLAKPFRTEELRRMVEETLAER